MNRQNRAVIGTLAGLLSFAPAVFGQFGTAVTGAAEVCKYDSYNKVGTVEFCVLSPTLLKDCVEQITNGKSFQTVKKQLTIPKSEFTFNVNVGLLSNTVGAHADASALGFRLLLPEGWTCTYESGNQCN